MKISRLENGDDENVNVKNKNYSIYDLIDSFDLPFPNVEVKSKKDEIIKQVNMCGLLWPNRQGVY